MNFHLGQTNVRLFLGRLSGVRNLLTMAFFEGCIRQFMGYLANLAGAQGSGERDVAHSQELFRALSVEIAAEPLDPSVDPFEGVDLLRTLIQSILHGQGDKLAA